MAKLRQKLVLTRATRLYLEQELEWYPRHKAEYEDIQNDVIYGCGEINEDTPHGTSVGMPHGTTVGQPTQNKAIQLISSRRLPQIERMVLAIRYVVLSLPLERRALVQSRYFDNPRTLTMAGIAQKLHISDKTLTNWTNGILIALAKELGMIS